MHKCNNGVRSGIWNFAIFLGKKPHFRPNHYTDFMLLIGLGNPGKEYEHTRHNVGFLVVDEFAKRHELSLRFKRAIEAELAESEIDGVSVILCKPQTLMNVSGRAIMKLMKKRPIDPKDVLVMYDDADLPFGTVRMKLGGSAAGHRGMQSILEQFASGTNIARVRIGIGRPDYPDVPLDEFVLQRWKREEEKTLPKIIDEAIFYIEKVIKLSV
jgi:PTH1 family peptidyl-tRNA hydrolase